MLRMFFESPENGLDVDVEKAVVVDDCIAATSAAVLFEVADVLEVPDLNDDDDDDDGNDVSGDTIILQLLVRERMLQSAKADVVDDVKVKVIDVVKVEEDGKVDVNDVVALLNVEDVVNLVYVEV